MGSGRSWPRTSTPPSKSSPPQLWDHPEEQALRQVSRGRSPKATGYSESSPSVEREGMQPRAAPRPE